jgi:hypothetical protein
MKRKTTKEFIEDAIKVHGGKYDYSLVEYINSTLKVKIICPIHGEFEQIANNHLQGKTCEKCSVDIVNLKNTDTLNHFIQKANQIHNNFYDYSLVDYKHSKLKVKIICPIHGEFEQIPTNHIFGQGCYDCSYEYRKKIMILTKEEFIKKSTIVHNNFYDYSKVIYLSAHNRVKIICPIHGEFEQIAQHHLNGHGCSFCNSSKGEMIIKEILQNHKIIFDYQKKFTNCKNIKELPFDFYLPKHNVCIEYDGRQHYMPIDFFGGIKEHMNLKFRDNIKNIFCRENNIELLRIKYDDNIEQKLQFLF